MLLALEGFAAAGQDTDAPSRAARWLAQDGVKPIADLVNAAAPGEVPVFCDRVGLFEALIDGRAIVLTGSFPAATVWRFDLTTFDGQFDMRRLYVPHGAVAFPDPNAIHTRRLAALLGDAGKALTHTGPWEIFNGEWLVPTARVALDGRHVYTSWFDLPSLDDQQAGRVYASFALEIDRPGKHTVRISFDDFPRHTRWRASRRQPERPEVTHTPNPLRPGHVASIAVGVDERVGFLRDVRLKPGLAGKHPRLGGAVEPIEPGPALGSDDKQVRVLIDFLDPDRGELWEYSDDAESMASGNDMDAGRKGLAACRTYDRLLRRLAPEARQAVDAAFRKRFEGIWRFFVFQRNYHPTGYAQNHSSKSVWALLGAGLAWDAPEAGLWLRWAEMVCRKRVELLGRDGSLEWMNEGRDYGLDFWETSRQLLRDCCGVDLARGAFFDNEWRYALHHAPSWPQGRTPAMIGKDGKIIPDVNVPLPDGAAPEGTPTDWHFDDCDQVSMRSGWGPQDLRLRLTAGSIFGRQGTPNALRYNWAHVPVNRGSVAIWRGATPILNEPGWDRTYRKGAGSHNCILVNDTDQWGGGQVWHPRLTLDQVGRIAFFADGDLLCAARADLAGAYPPAAEVRALARVVVHLKPDHFLVFDRLETHGAGQGEWRFHAAFVEPQDAPGRFTLFGALRKTQKSRREQPATYDAAFEKDADARCEAAFLAPGGLAAEVGMSDVYFRWGGFRQPVRHLRVVQRGDGPLTLLTAFAPRLALSAGGAGAAELYRFGPGPLQLDGTAIQGEGPDTFTALRKGQAIRRVGTQPRDPPR